MANGVPGAGQPAVVGQFGSIGLNSPPPPPPVVIPNTSATGGPLAPTSQLPPEDAALDIIVQSFVAGCSQLPPTLVRAEWQNPPPPIPEVGTNWCAFSVMDEDPIPGQVISLFQPTANGGLGQTTTQANVYVSFLACFMGPNARGYANLFRDGAMIAQNREALQLLGIGLVEMPRRQAMISRIINQQVQRRMDMTFRLMVPYVYIWPIEGLLSAPIKLTADDGDSVSVLVTNPLLSGE